MEGTTTRIIVGEEDRTFKGYELYAGAMSSRVAHLEGVVNWYKKLLGIAATTFLCGVVMLGLCLVVGYKVEEACRGAFNEDDYSHNDLRLGDRDDPYRRRVGSYQYRRQ